MKFIGKKAISTYLSTNVDRNNLISYRTAGGRYWKIFIDREFSNISTSNKSRSFLPQYNRYVFISLLNSNMFWWYFANFFDLYNLKDYMIFNFKFDYNNEKELVALGQQLMESYELNKEVKSQFIKSRNQATEFETFNPKKSKLIIDGIDRCLGKLFGFSDAELDYIISYDIKYRMGKDDSDEDA